MTISGDNFKTCFWANPRSLNFNSTTRREPGKHFLIFFSILRLPWLIANICGTLTGTMSENVAWSTSNILSEKKSSLDVHFWRLKPVPREIRPLDKLVNPIQHWLTKQLTKHYLQRKKNVASFLRDVISGKLSLKKRLDDDLAFYLVLRRKKHMYRKVANSSLSRLVARFQIFRRLMKGKFDSYVLWPLTKKSQNWIVDCSTARNFTVCRALIIQSFVKT